MMQVEISSVDFERDWDIDGDDNIFVYFRETEKIGKKLTPEIVRIVEALQTWALDNDVYKRSSGRASYASIKMLNGSLVQSRLAMLLDELSEMNLEILDKREVAA